MDYLQIARDPQLWFVCLPPVIMVLIQASFSSDIQSKRPLRLD